MKTAYTNLLWLFIIFIFLSVIFFLLPEYLGKGVPFSQASLMLAGSFLISLTVILIFMKGFQSGGRSWLIHTIAAISLKFILYLFLIVFLVYFLKNRSLEFILTFFVIYLSFTSYLLFSIFKMLKTKNLEK